MCTKKLLKLYIDNGFLMVIKKITAIKIWQTKINGLAYSESDKSKCIKKWSIVFKWFIKLIAFTSVHEWCISHDILIYDI